MKLGKRTALFLTAALLVLSSCAGGAHAGETYVGVGQGNNGEIKVQVTLENDGITAVDVLAHEETTGLSDPAFEQIPVAIIAAGTTNVDAVAGATNTSKGIVEAVNDALAQAGVETAAPAEENVRISKDILAAGPKITTLENGVRIQKTPDSGYPWSWFVTDPEWKAYNTYYFNADQRGCSSCHDLEDCMLNIGHCLYIGKYAAEDMLVQNCVACHSDAYSGNNLQQPIHSLHVGKAAFTSMGGSCESCHYIDSDGNYLRWDYVKYDVLHGITDVDAQSVNVSVEWDQEQLTAPENVFQVLWGVHRGTDTGYSYDYIEKTKSDDIRDTYKITFEGDMDNPCELSINEMIEMFGSVTRKLAGQCTINGTGGSLIYQREVTGVPLERVVEYLGIHEGANVVFSKGVDNYPSTLALSTLLEGDALFVYEMEGEELTADAGYPVGLWANNITCGLGVRNLASVTIYTNPDYVEDIAAFGGYTDVVSGRLISKPNIGVLTAESGTIYTPGETVHLEGYAFAYNEPITKLEFSFDHGATWQEIPTDGATSERWVYWKMDVNDLEPGAYVLCMRATSLMKDGSNRVNEEIPKFLINVK